MKINLTIEELEFLLDEQRKLTIEKCMSNTSYYNAKSTDGQSFTLDIDADKFRKNGMETRYPEDFRILKKYLSE